jgi:hypothetical protein
MGISRRRRLVRDGAVAEATGRYRASSFVLVRVGSVCLVVAGVLAGGTGTASGVARTNGRDGASKGHFAWCNARQLSISVPTIPHSIQVQVGGDVMWFLQLTHEGTAPCVTGDLLKLVGERTAKDAAPSKFRAQQSYDPRQKPFVLRQHERAYVMMETPGILSPSQGKGCHSNMLLTFKPPRGDGTVSVRTPTAVSAICPTRWISMSQTRTSTWFSNFILEFTPSTTMQLPYDHHARTRETTEIAAAISFRL